MSVITTTCPHCEAKNMTFHYLASRVHPKIQDLWHTFFSCAGCAGPLLCSLKYRGEDAQRRAGGPGNVDGDLLENDWRIRASWPSVRETIALKDVPPNLAKFFDQGCDNVERENWDAAGMMFRRVLDTATRVVEREAEQKDPNFAGKNLFGRIESLADRHLITPSMKDWAHKVRLDGNDAAHDEEPFDDVRAKALEEYCAVFLLYCFTMPAMVKAGEEAAEPTAGA